ncbi:unnamed protein product [Symbiodinium sp. CCMP2592]|nr:unnamed protein product [Symbiodinium sp. CCMP2592]
MSKTLSFCPCCSTGKLSKLMQFRNNTWKYKCSSSKCRAWLNPHHLHPLFTEGKGSTSASLQAQASVLLLLLVRIPLSTVHLLTHVNHKAVEDMYRKMCELRRYYVEKEEKKITFGTGQSWKDIEADEATFNKRDISASVEFKHLIKRQEVYLDVGAMGGLNPKVRVKKAPGPGAIRKIEWQTLGNKLLKGRKVVLHTDSAKSYKAYIDGVIHDRVVHCKKRVKANGRFKWINPKYVGIVEHKIPGTQKILKCKSGTQVIDRALKGRIVINQNCKAGSKLLRAKLRSVQYEYWNKNADLWLHTGVLCQAHMQSMLAE